MATNKLALIRYKVLDECLRNIYRKWTLEDLIETVSDALYEYEGIDSGVSKRTIQGDIQIMRSDKLGYNAPIVVVDRKYYTYSDKNYSITNVPIQAREVEKMKEAINILKQFSGFSYFEEMNDTVAKLENYLYTSSQQTKNYIQFENNKRLKGIEFINPLYQAILNKKVLGINYQSFKAKQPNLYVLYPYLLKEYRNRWFLIGKRKNITYLFTLALDRIINFEILEEETFQEYEGQDLEEYYSNLIGVTKFERDIAQKVILEFSPEHAPYVLTKPLHPSQELLETKENGWIIIQIEVVLNFELEREILGFGNGIKVLAPRLLINRIFRKVEGLEEIYKH